LLLRFSKLIADRRLLITDDYTVPAKHLPITAIIAIIHPMSEYIEIETEISDDDRILTVYTNLRLNEGEAEQYHSISELEEGSPVAQALAVIEGITSLQIKGSDLTVQRDPDTPWHIIISDISAALKDFFL
jgi:hypothetical protein